MHDLKPITPLGADQPRTDTVGPVTLSEITTVALASVAARHGKAAKTKTALKAFSDQAAPKPGQAKFGDIGVFWVGPDQWMVTAPFESHEDLAAQVKAVAKDNASVTEQTDGWCHFDLTGSGLPDVFELLCPAPVRKWKGGEATRTSIDHLGCFLLCKTPEHLTVIGPRSSAGSLHHALLTAMRSAH